MFLLLLFIPFMCVVCFNIYLFIPRGILPVLLIVIYSYEHVGAWCFSWIANSFYHAGAKSE